MSFQSSILGAILSLAIAKTVVKKRFGVADTGENPQATKLKNAENSLKIAQEQKRRKIEVNEDYKNLYLGGQKIAPELAQKILAKAEEVKKNV